MTAWDFLDKNIGWLLFGAFLVLMLAPDTIRAWRGK